MMSGPSIQGHNEQTCLAPDLVIANTWDTLTCFLPSIDVLRLATVNRDFGSLAARCPFWNFSFVRSSSHLNRLIPRFCKNASKVKLHPYSATDRSIPLVAEACGLRLQHLDLQFCSVLTDKSLLSLANCPNLTHLDLQKCYELTDSALATLAEHCRDLEHLNVRLCFNISDKGLRMVAKYCKKLVFLDLR